MNIIVTISDEEYKAMAHVVPSVEEWIQNALTAKARACVYRIVEENTEYQPKKIEETQRLSIVKNLTLSTRIERDAEAKRLFDLQMSGIPENGNKKGE
jgi:hypothetical protein